MSVRNNDNAILLIVNSTVELTNQKYGLVQARRCAEQSWHRQFIRKTE